jgi:hypothetical protein
MLAPVLRTAAALTAVAFLALVPAAGARQIVDVPAAAGPALSKLHHSGVAVLLPATASLDINRTTHLYPSASVSASRGEWGLSLSPVRNCGADACFLASFSGAKGQPLGFGTNVALADGLRGYFKPLSCGGSCSPPSIQWIEKGVRYEIQANALGRRPAFVAMADSAIRAGDRR